MTRPGAHYAIRRFKNAEEGYYRSEYLHRFILNITDKTRVDHEDGNGLNCRRYNLRVATPKQNAQNRKPIHGRRFKGVYPRRKRFAAYIGDDGKSIYLGLYKTEAEAARAYDTKARELHSEFARLNFPSPKTPDQLAVEAALVVRSKPDHPITIYKSQLRARSNGLPPVALSRTQRDLLMLLASGKPQTITTLAAQLRRSLNYIRTLVSGLNRKLDREIKAVRGVGYRSRTPSQRTAASIICNISTEVRPERPLLGSSWRKSKNRTPTISRTPSQ